MNSFIKRFKFLICASIFMIPLVGNAQMLLSHWGAEQAENLNGVYYHSKNHFCFGLQYLFSTQYQDSLYEATLSGVLLIESQGNNERLIATLNSLGQTEIKAIEYRNEAYFIAGNAFDQLYWNNNLVIQRTGDFDFLLKVSSTGALLATQSIKSKGNSQMIDLAVDENNVVALYQAAGEVILGDTIDAGARSIVAVNWSDSFRLIQYVLYQSSSNVAPRELLIQNDHIYIGGQFRDTLFVEDQVLINTTFDADLFLIAYNFQDKRIGFAHHIRGVFEDELLCMAQDDTGIYLGGRFEGDLRFDELQIITGLTVGAFIGKFNFAGDIEWLHKMDGESNALGIVQIVPTASILHLGLIQGSQTIYRSDTLMDDRGPGFLNLGLLELDEAQEVRSWQLLEGDRNAVLQNLYVADDQVFCLVEFDGSFLNQASRGFFDVMHLSWDPVSTDAKILKPWTFYPNPAKDIIFFEEPMSGFLFDLKGRKVCSFKNKLYLDLSLVQAGLYVVGAEGCQGRLVEVIK